MFSIYVLGLPIPSTAIDSPEPLTMRRFVMAQC